MLLLGWKVVNMYIWCLFIIGGVMGINVLFMCFFEFWKFMNVCGILFEIELVLKMLILLMLYFFSDYKEDCFSI